MGRSNASLDKQMMDYMSFMANRIETAAKQSVTDCNHLVNAAEMRERAEEVRARHSLYYGRVDYEIETVVVDEVDYILHGDAGKEEK